MIFSTINPSNEEIIKEYRIPDSSEINQKLTASESAFNFWRKTSFAFRADLFQKLSEILLKKNVFLAELMALEMGKPIAQGIAEAEKCAWVCRYYAENAEQFLADEIVKTEATRSFITFQPIGPILAIMPWNFPFWQVFRFAAPNLMAGNTGVLKHSRNTMGCAVEIENIFLEAGFPENVFTNLIIGADETESVIKSSQIKAVTLTGSTTVGKHVAAVSGSVLKKCVLELGGSDPYIILADADLEKTAETCVNARLINSGQSCIAAKRFIVEEAIIDEFEELFTSKMASRVMGNPFDSKVHLGPQARKDLRNELHQQVISSIERGAKLLLGGEIPEGKGFFYPPTVLTSVSEGMPARNEELFGPVASIIKANDAIDAVKIANEVSFGLGAAIFSSDIEKAEHLAKYEIQAGCCFINNFVKSDPRLPFGGIKESGFGRELSTYGIKEFVNIKTVSY